MDEDGSEVFDDEHGGPGQLRACVSISIVCVVADLVHTQILHQYLLS